jgi:hypothetical protein
VNVLVVQVRDIELLAGSANVAILVEVTFEFTVDGGHETVTTEIEFTVVDKQGMVDVLFNIKKSMIKPGKKLDMKELSSFGNVT